MAKRRGRTGRRTSQWTEADARRILEEWAASGQPLYSFCRARGITPQRLAWWRDRLAKSSAAPLLLAPARVTAGGELNDPGGIVLRLSGDLTIELGDVTPEWVARLIHELTGRS